MPTIKSHPVWSKAVPDVLPSDEGVKCSKCGTVWKGIMFYSCPKSDCPIQKKVTF